MDLTDVCEQITEAVTSQLAKIDARQAEQRARWYRDEDGKKVEVEETFTILGKDYEFPMIGLELPTRLDVDWVKVKLNTDLSLDKRGGIHKFIARAFGGSDEESSIFDVQVKFKQSRPNRGILALHKNAATRIQEKLSGLVPKQEE